jgi:prophage tail gpP-like protein
MSLELDVGGKSYVEFTSLTVTRSLDTIAGTFEFIAACNINEPFPIPRGSKCQVRCNGVPILTGYVDTVSVDYAFDLHTITIAGRDKTCDIVDSKLDGKLEFKAPITLDQVLQKTLEDIGASDVQVINKVSGLEPFTKKELVSGKVGGGAFEFMDAYAAKRQVVLTTDGLGNVVVTRASTVSTNLRIQNIIGAKDNTIQAASGKYDDSERLNEYKFFAQQNHAADPNDDTPVDEGAFIVGTAADQDTRPSRKYRAMAEGCTETKKLTERAQWEANIREAKSFTYTVKMAQHSPYDYNGEPYQPNTLVMVIDDFVDVNAELLIVKTTHRLDNIEGSTTELEIMSREAFVLQKSEAPKNGDEPDGSKYASYDNSASSFTAAKGFK